MERKIEVGEIIKYIGADNDPMTGELGRVKARGRLAIAVEQGWSTTIDRVRLAELSDVCTPEEGALFVGRWVRLVQDPDRTYQIAHAALASWELDGGMQGGAILRYRNAPKYAVLLPLSYSPEKPDTDPVLYGTAGVTAAEAGRRAFAKQKAEEKLAQVSGGNMRGDVDWNLTHIYDGKAWLAAPACDCNRNEAQRHAKTCIRVITVQGFGWWYCECGELWSPRETRCEICKREKPVLPKIESTEGTIDGPLEDLLIGSGSPDPHCPECRCDTRCEAHVLTCSRRALLIVHEMPEQRAAQEAARKRMACWRDVSDRPPSFAYARWFCEEHARWLMI